MKYIIRNICLFLKNEKIVSVFVFLSIFSSVLLLHFSYALYQSYQEKKKSADSDLDYLTISVTDRYEKYDKDENGKYKIKKKQGEDYLTVGMLKKAITDMPNDIQKNLEDVMLDAYIDEHFLSFVFNVKDNQIVLSDFYMENTIKNGILTEGRIFTKEEYKKGMKVAWSYDDQYDAEPSYTRSITTSDGKYITVGGKKYEVIGKQKFPDLPEIPITSVDDDICIYDYIEFDFGHPVNHLLYEQLQDWVSLSLEGHAVTDEIELPDDDHVYLYNTMILIAVLISIISAFNFAIMYRYILQRRKKEYRILRICGMGKAKAVRMYIMECLLMSLPVYFIAVLFFSKAFLTYVNRNFSYISQEYPNTVYIVLFAVYYLSSLIVLLGMILFNLKHEEKMQIGGGRG